VRPTARGGGWDRNRSVKIAFVRASGRKLHPPPGRWGAVGLSALRKVLPPQPFDVAQLKGKVLAVDADNLIWSFVTALAATGGLPTDGRGRSFAHLLGLAGRLRLYAQWGARTAWVFDGAQPALKEPTLLARAQAIAAAKEEGDLMRGTEVTEADLEECRTLLQALGLPHLVAPGEAEAQCAHLVASGHAWAAVTQDWDIALFGAPRALRNLTGSEKRSPEIVDLRAALDAAGLTREQLVDAAILIGTDYNEGIQGVGPVKAVKLLQKHRTLEAALAALGVAMPEGKEVRRILLEHPVDAAFRPRFAAPDGPAAMALLTGRGFTEEAARNLVDDVARLHRA
jgi:flap endonuclease-1